MVRQIAASWRRELRPDRLLPGLSMGLVTGVLIAMLEISFALLIFSGPLAGRVGDGIGLTLFAGLVLGLAVALMSSSPGIVGMPQDSPAVMIAVVTANLVAAMPAGVSSESVFATVVVTIALTSLLAGLFLLALGWSKQGKLVRYIPYPVIGGFLAGTGWLLVRGGVGVMADAPLSLTQLDLLFRADVLFRWLPGLLFAIALLWILRRFRHFMIMPAMLLGAIVLFYLVVWAAGFSVGQASAQGWLLGPFPEGALWRPVTLDLLNQVHWPTLSSQAGNIGAILLISVVSLLLNASSLELIARRDMDLNREMQAAGVGNVLASLGGGGPVGYHALSLSALNYRTGVSSRLVGVTAALLCGALMLAGTTLLTYFPKVVLGGLILFLGIGFLVEWLYDARPRFSKGDYAIVVLILVAMNAIGVLEGVGLGLALAIVLFLVDYSRLSVIRRTLSGRSYRSNVDRPLLYQNLLRQEGDRLIILELQGYLFFGTAYRLLERVKQQIDAKGRPKPRFVVLDFRQVNGMDASGAMSFARMAQLAQTQGFNLVLTHLSPTIQQQLEQKALAANGGEAAWRIFPDLDHGVEWCEEQMIAAFVQEGLIAQKPKTMMQQLAQFLTDSPQSVGSQEYLAAKDDPATETDPLRGALSYMERVQVEAGQVLIRQGDPPRGLYFVESGKVTIQLETGEGSPVRLRSRGESALFGEMGLYAGTRASASVVVDEPGVFYYLSAENLVRMEAESPELAIAFHKFIARHLSEMLLGANQTLQALLA